MGQVALALWLSDREQEVLGRALEVSEVARIPDVASRIGAVLDTVSRR